MVFLFIYSRFEALLSEKGIKKKHIADSLHRAPAICQDWKNGKSVPNDEQLQIVADILGTTPEYLTGKTDFPGIRENNSAARNSDELTRRNNELTARMEKLFRQLTPEQAEFLLLLAERMLEPIQEKLK